MYIASQIVSGFALTLNASGRLFKQQSTNMMFTAISNILVAISFYLLGAYMGLVCMIISAVRTFVFYLYAKNNWSKNLYLLMFFIVLYLGTSFIAFSNWLEYTLIALKGITYTYGAWQHKPKTFRVLSIASCGFTIWYNALYFAYVNIIGEAVCIIFVILVMIQDLKTNKTSALQTFDNNLE